MKQIEIISNQQEAGFTLVELLVALMLLGMLMLITYGTLNFSVKAMERSKNIATANEEVAQAQNFIRRVIKNAVVTQNNFSGSEKKLTFLSMMDRNGSAGLYQISLSKSGGDFVLDWEVKNNRENRTISQGNQFRDAVVLMEQVDDMQFSYGAIDAAKTNVWQPVWTDSETMPKYIKLTVDAEKFWPDLVMELNTTHTIDCWYDPVSRGCQRR